MKLFVWHGAGVLQDFTSGQITVIAPDLESAVLEIKKICPHGMGLFPPHPTDIVDPRRCVTWGGG